MMEHDHLAAKVEDSVGNTSAIRPGRNRPNNNAVKHGLSARQRPTQQHQLAVHELADAIVGAGSSMRRSAALELAAAEFDYRRLEQYRLALLDAEIGSATKAVPSASSPEDVFIDPRSALRIIRLLERIDRYETPRWRQLRRALGRYAVLEI